MPIAKKFPFAATFLASLVLNVAFWLGAELWRGYGIFGVRVAGVGLVVAFAFWAHVKSAGLRIATWNPLAHLKP